MQQSKKERRDKNGNRDHRERRQPWVTILICATYAAILMYAVVYTTMFFYTRDYVNDKYSFDTGSHISENQSSSTEPVIEPETAETIPTTSVEMTIEERIQAACEAYGVPYDITIAIARLETGWFTSDAYIYGNNPGGLSVNETPIYFDTIEDGVYAFIDNLAHNYYAIGLDTPEKIGEKYCPVDPNWASKVYEVMAYEN